MDKGSKANVPDTQTATFDFGDLDIVWEHRTWARKPIPITPGAPTIYGDKGTLKLSVYSYDFIPLGGGTPIHKDVVYELEQYPEDKTEKDWSATSPRPSVGTCSTSWRRSGRERQTGGRHRGRPHFDCELHPGQPRAATWANAHLGRRERASPR